MLMELKGKIERFLRTVLFSKLLADECAHSRLLEPRPFGRSSAYPFVSAIL